jgi:hypothetical protein
LQLDLGVGGSEGKRVTKIEEIFLGIVEGVVPVVGVHTLVEHVLVIEEVLDTSEMVGNLKRGLGEVLGTLGRTEVVFQGVVVEEAVGLGLDMLVRFVGWAVAKFYIEPIKAHER